MFSRLWEQAVTRENTATKATQAGQPGPRPRRRGGMARAVPEARLILGHIGGGGDWEWTVKGVVDVPSVYADTSGSVIDGGMIEFAVRHLGWKRLLFATDMSVDEGVGLFELIKKHDGERPF